MKGGFYAYYPYSKSSTRRKTSMQNKGKGKGLRKMRKMKTFKRRL